MGSGYLGGAPQVAAPPGADTSARLRVDWPACQGRGLCAQVAPELISMDEWGFPIVAGAIPPQLHPTARAAVNICPHAALRLTPSHRP